jgi:aryl-alcohol dehydrogenase-like predicted oxidoreductase
MASHSTDIPMQRLGRSGLVVSRLALGTMTFGGRTDEKEALRIVSHARERGVNFIDTADAYNRGASEEVVGRAIAANRFDWILATKLANPMGPGPGERGLSRRWIIEATERSLKRLGTETIDIQYLHKEDQETPLEETVRAIADLVRAGKIRHFGVSNHRAWRVARICALCDSFGIDRPVICQLYYHALYRVAEVELLPACHALGVGTIAYSPLARGVLTGKYATDAPPPADSRLGAGDKRIAETEFHPANLAAAAALGEHCRKRGVSLAAFASAWVLANPMMNAVVAGPRTFEQLQGYLEAFDVEIGPEDEAAVTALVAQGTTAIPHYIDPAYPVEGRPGSIPRRR